MLAGNAAALYGFDLDALAPDRREDRTRRRGGRPAAVAGRLPGGLTEVPGVLGSRARRALTSRPEGDRMSVDIRSRVDGEVEAVDPASVLRGGPARRRSSGTRSAARTRCACSRPRPLVLEVDGDAWTLAGRRRHRPRAPGGVDDAGDGAAPVGGAAERPRHRPGHGRRHADQRDRSTSPSVASTRCSTGGCCSAARSMPARRTCPARSTSSTPSGAPLALDRSFAADAPLDEMGDFLQRAGYLHIDGRVHEDEMAAVSLDMDAAAPTYTPDDGRSWWARNTDGDHLLVRMQYFDEVSPAVERLVDDDRLQRLAGLTGDGHVYGSMEDNRIEALFKPFGVVEGISDLPWHKDCALGRHSYDCCSMTVGISVTGADARVGPAARGRGIAPRADVAVGPPTRTAPTCPPSTSRPAPATSPCTCRARCTSRSRRSSASGGSSTPGSACRCAAPTPSAKRRAPARHPRGRPGEGAVRSARRS